MSLPQVGFSRSALSLSLPTCLVAAAFLDRCFRLRGSAGNNVADRLLRSEFISMKLYVGNLSYSTTQETLEREFGAHGRVDEVAVITDRETGRPRGFAFVSMNNDQEGRAAIEALNGAEVDGRAITVNEARPKTDRGGYGGGGGGGRGGYGGGGGGGGRGKW